MNADVQAKYTLDLLMDDAKNGVAKTYLYQLMDAYQPGSPQGDDGFGLFDPNNLSKEAATAIRNLTTILADPGANASTFTPAPLSYTVTGLPSTGNSMVLEKSNGAYDIVVWNEPQIWNELTGTEIAATNVDVNVQLGGTYSEVKLFDPLSTMTPVETLSNVSSVQLGVTDHPLIVEIEPAPTVAAQTPNQSWQAGQAVNLALASNTFVDPQQQAMTYAATLADGTPLPSWLQFDPTTQTFGGTAPTSATDLSIKVVATDTSGLFGSEGFSASITAAVALMAQSISGLPSHGGTSAAYNAQTSTDPVTTLVSPLH